MGIIIGDKTPDVYLSLLSKFSEKYQVNSRRLYWYNWEPYLVLCENK
jgi:hypothetical protein